MLSRISHSHQISKPSKNFSSNCLAKSSFKEMILSTVTATLSIQSKSLSQSQSCTYLFDRFKNLNPSANLLLLPRSLFPAAPTNNILTAFLFLATSSSRSKKVPVVRKAHASLLETPVLWAGRLCIFYALLKAGLVGSPSNPILTGSADDLGFAEWIGSLQGNPDKAAANKRKLVSKWHPTTKGTLRRNYRVPSKAEGMRLLRAIVALLSEDDHFVDASSHKGCQIRRESAHGESVCCNNVRALFDELPTPHVVVEITAFPAGPLNEKDYVKAEKLERVLRSGPNI